MTGATIQRSKVVRGAAAAVCFVAAAGFGAPAVFAGESQQPTASAESSCRNNEGYIHVSIVDNFSTTYDVYIGGVLVDDDVTDSDGGTYNYGPYADGSYQVEVIWQPDGDEVILDTTIVIDCVPDESTTTAPTTTAAPEETTTTAATAPPAIPAAPTYTG